MDYLKENAFDLWCTDTATLWSVRVSDTRIRGHAPDTRRIRVRYATWRIVDQTVGHMIQTRLGHGEDTVGHGVLISDFNMQQRKKEEGERRWEVEGGGVPLVPGFLQKREGRRGEDENRDG